MYTKSIICFTDFSAGLALLAEHAEQFKEYLAKDTEVCDCVCAISFDTCSFM